MDTIYMRTLELLNYDTVFTSKLYESRGNDMHLLEKRKDRLNNIVFPHVSYSKLVTG